MRYQSSPLFCGCSISPHIYFASASLGLTASKCERIGYLRLIFHTPNHKKRVRLGKTRKVHSFRCHILTELECYCQVLFTLFSIAAYIFHVHAIKTPKVPFPCETSTKNCSFFLICLQLISLGAKNIPKPAVIFTFSHVDHSRPPAKLPAASITTSFASSSSSKGISGAQI